MTAKSQLKTNIVERYKKGESSHQISKSEGCSYNAVLRELKRRGINTGLRFWTKEEIGKLNKFYPITSSEELLKKFPHRTKETIEGMASNLGLKKKECKITCRGCGEEFTIKSNHGREFCLKCVKEQWEQNNLKNGRKRKKQWIQRNPEYMNQYYRQLRKESPQYRLDCNMGVAIYQALRSKKAGRRWETLVDYTLKDLIKYLEEQFDDKMNWGNYGSYWHIDHIKPRSLFRYTSAEDPKFKECWSLKNLQPLEKIANFKKGNAFGVTLSRFARHIYKEVNNSFKDDRKRTHCQNKKIATNSTQKRLGFID